MKLALKIVAVILALFVALFVLQMVASESGEVVVVQTTGADGTAAETRLWVVEHEGSMWLRSGSSASSWYQRMQANPDVVVTRGEQTYQFVAVPRVDMRDAVNAKLNDKYGWADDFISMLFGRDDAIPIELKAR